MHAVEHPQEVIVKYIIMCGGTYTSWDTPRHLIEINGEPIIERTIRLLNENNVTDIAISSNIPIFERFGVPVLKHDNGYVTTVTEIVGGQWCDAFYPTTEPTCYLFGDVVFSPEAIKTIVETETDDIEFFASSPPFASEYMKPWAEPFALKVANTKHLRRAIKETKWLDYQGAFRRRPIMWELWQVIKETPLNVIDYGNYTAINDYTCDIDFESDVGKFETILGKLAP